MLKKVVFFVVLLALAKPALASFNPFAPFSYRMGLQLTNPLSFSSKYGGSLAYRFGQNAFMISYIKYVGAYPGKQFRFEYQRYFKDPISRKHNEWYFYSKVVQGDAGYESDKLSTLGEQIPLKLSALKYYGGGAGIGRRFNKGHLNINLNLGLKYCPFSDEIPADQRDKYTVFYATGPGSVIDANISFGLQY